MFLSSDQTEILSEIFDIVLKLVLGVGVPVEIPMFEDNGHLIAQHWTSNKNSIENEFSDSKNLRNHDNIVTNIKISILSLPSLVSASVFIQKSRILKLFLKFCSATSKTHK